MKLFPLAALFFVLCQTCYANGVVCDTSGCYILFGESISREYIAYMIVINFVVIATVALYYFFNNKIKSHEARERNMVVAVQNLSEELKIVKKHDLDKKQLMGELFEARYAIINELCATYYEYQGTSKEQKKIADEVKRHINSISGNGNIGDLESCVNRYNGNIMRKFRDEFPNIKESECSMFMYMVAGFSCKAISVFIDEKLDVVYNRKSRLKSKIKLSNSAYKNDFLQLMN